MSKYTNDALSSNNSEFTKVDNPVRFFAEHKAKKGIIRLVDTGAIDEDTQKSTVYEVGESLEFILLAIRYKMEGEDKRDFKISSPMVSSLSDPAPLYIYSAAGNEGQLGEGDFIWSKQKEEIKNMGQVKKMGSKILLFGILYNREKNECSGLIQQELSGYGFGGWINASSGEDLALKFDAKIKAVGSQVQNTHTSAKAGDMLTLPGIELREPDNISGEIFISKQGKNLREMLNEFLEAKTYVKGQMMEGTAEAVKAVTEQSNPIADLPLNDDATESEEDLPRMA